MRSGDAFYSKQLKRNVLFHTTSVDFEYIDATGSIHVLDPSETELLIRQCHYDAAMASNQRLIEAFASAQTLGLLEAEKMGYRFEWGYKEALNYISERLVASQKSSDV